MITIKETIFKISSEFSLPPHNVWINIFNDQNISQIYLMMRNNIGKFSKLTTHAWMQSSSNWAAKNSSKANRISHNHIKWHNRKQQSSISFYSPLFSFYFYQSHSISLQVIFVWRHFSATRFLCLCSFQTLPNDRYFAAIWDLNNR